MSNASDSWQNLFDLEKWWLNRPFGTVASVWPRSMKGKSSQKCGARPQNEREIQVLYPLSNLEALESLYKCWDLQESPAIA